MKRKLLAAGLALVGALGCETEPPAGDAIPIGLLLSYTGYLAANSINSERAVLMAIEAANAGGGVGGRPLRVLAKDTRSDPNKVAVPAQQLLDAGATVMLGPDTTDLVAQVRNLLLDRTVILPSNNTSSDVEWRGPAWFVMGAGTGRVACELMAQLQSDGRKNPLLLVNNTGQNNALAWDLQLGHGLKNKVLLPNDLSSNKEIIPTISRAILDADSFVLAAFPTSASSLIYALTARGEIADPGRWYMSPTLHTPAFLESIPKGVLDGARGVSSGTVSGSADFRAAFAQRWHDVPLDDAYPFYDAAAVSALGLQRAVQRTGAVPDKTGLFDHILAVSRAGGTQVQWNELDKGLALLARGEEIEYFGLSGLIQFDAIGQTPTASTKWWTIADQAFSDIPRQGDCM
jgi:ABC-type branched-subunit amino acid transport system substrate-binding protein